MTGSQSILELPSYSLILDGDNGLFNQVYKSKKSIDTTLEYHFKFIADRIYELNNIFLICNKNIIAKRYIIKYHQKALIK